MPTIAPWLEPPNFLQAAQLGSEIGLQQSEQAEKASEAASQLGLGYAQLASQDQRSAAERAQAAAQLKAEQDRYNLLGQQANARLGQGQERIDDTQAQHTAADDIANKRLDLSGQRLQDTEDRNHQMIDLEYERIKSGPGTEAQKQAQATAIANDAIAWMTDPDTANNPIASLQKHPLAIQSKTYQDWYQSSLTQNRGANKPPPPATITRLADGNEVKYSVPENTAASALGTNFLGSGGGVPATPSTPTQTTPSLGFASPGKPAAAGYRIGAVYKGGLKYLGGDINDPNSWQSVNQ